MRLSMNYTTTEGIEEGDQNGEGTMADTQRTDKLQWYVARKRQAWGHRPGSRFPYFLLLIKPWPHYLSSLSLGVLIYKMERLYLAGRVT